MKCVIIDDEPLAIRVLSRHIEKTNGLKLMQAFERAFDALHYVQTREVDLVFLDIQMPGLNGLDFLKVLKNPAQVVICSAYQEYALQAFDFEVTDYLLKPVSYERFLKAVSKALNTPKYIFPLPSKLEQNQAAPPSDFFYIKDKAFFHKVRHEEIYFIEGLRNYCYLHIHEKRYTISGNLGLIAKKLPQDQFLRIHKSYIVAVDKIAKYTQHSVILLDRELPIGRTYKKALMRYLNNLSW